MEKVQININLASQGAFGRCKDSVGKLYSYQAVHWLQVVLIVQFHFQLRDTVSSDACGDLQEGFA